MDRLVDNVLKSVRKEKGFSVRELSSKSGVPRRTIENWERLGMGHATIGSAVKVAKALGCTLDDLTKEES